MWLFLLDVYSSRPSFHMYLHLEYLAYFYISFYSLMVEDKISLVYDNSYTRNPMCSTADRSAEILQARREWQDIFKVLRKKKFTTKITVPNNALIQNWWRNKKLFRQEKLREFNITKPALQQMLKGLIQSRNTREEKRATKSTPNN